ncbi:MAG: nucleoside kinase, partial [Anaerolineaceae bacterium]
MFEKSDQYQLVSPRTTIEIHLPDGRVISGPRGSAIGSFLRKLPEWQDPPIVAAIINGDLRELTFPMVMDARVQPVTVADADGARLYRRSLTFLLEVAFEDLHPKAALTVDHSVASGGFYSQVAGRAPLSEEEVH